MKPIFPRTTDLFLTVALLGLASVSFAANPSGTGPAAAQESVKKFSVADGLQASLFAAEPMVRNPTDMDVDERGRVWITEGVNYRVWQKWGVLEPEGDRIVVLEDANGDGIAEKETVFYQDPSINAALGICVLGNKVIVSDSPNVFILTDSDGDGKADKRELLFTGISGKDHDHGVHAFVFGPDGKLYFNMGNEGKQLYYPVQKDVPLHGAITNVDMKPVVDLDGNTVNSQGRPYRMGMVFRCNIDGSQLETLAWNFRNNYEVAVDSFGALWQSDNDDDGNRGVRINYVMEHGNYGYADEMTGAGWPVAWDKVKALGADPDSKVFYEWHQYDPGVVPNLLNTGAGSPTGILVYEGDLLPPVFRNQLIHCDAGPRVVRAYTLQPDRAGFRAAITNILTTEDTWFRPSDVCVAPDGSIYIADWNDAGVGGHNMADQKLDLMTGRVYRVAPRTSSSRLTRPDFSTPRSCVVALQFPNQSTRYLAWTKLNQMQGAAEKELLGLWKSENPRMRARALQLLARIKGRETHSLAEAIKDRDPDIRVAALRIACELKLDVLPLVETLVRDRSAAVRRQCAITLRGNSSEKAAKLWAQLATQFDGLDRWYLEALGIGAEGQWDSFFAAWLDAAGQNWDTVPGREIVWRSRSKKTPALLAKIISNNSRTASERDHFFRSLDFISGPEKEAALLELLTVK